LRCFSPSSHWTLAVLIAALPLAACDKSGGAPDPAAQVVTTPAAGAEPVSAPPIAALPLATAAPPPLVAAPDYAALPPPKRAVRLAPRPRGERYRPVERAYALGEAFGDTPPDYTVDYDGTRPWVWRTDEGAYRVVERLPQGDRSYYYDERSNDPYFVRDGDYGYAYDNGDLIGVYDGDGAPIDDARAARRADAAARYFDRARALRRAAESERRQAAYDREWQDRRADVADQQRRWRDAGQRDADWRTWREARAADERRAFDGERRQRLAYAAAIAAA
jgi:hypothetical protein